ncbi:phage holin family protein [Brucellaceae bacterium C25G]
MLRLLTPLISSILKQELHQTAQQTKRSVIASAIMGIFICVGCVFLLIALFLYLSTLVSQLAASLIIAAAALLIALVAFIIVKIINEAEKRKRRERLEADKSAFVATASLAAVEAVLKRPILAAALPLATLALSSLLSDKKGNDEI